MKKILITGTKLSPVWLLFFLAVALAPRSVFAQASEQLVSAARAERDLFFVAGPTTFGGKKGLSEIEAAFNKRFGLDSRIRFSAGPEMNAWQRG